MVRACAGSTPLQTLHMHRLLIQQSLLPALSPNIAHLQSPEMCHAEPSPFLCTEVRAPPPCYHIHMETWKEQAEIFILMSDRKFRSKSVERVIAWLYSSRMTLTPLHWSNDALTQGNTSCCLCQTDGNERKYEGYFYWLNVLLIHFTVAPR